MNVDTYTVFRIKWRAKYLLVVVDIEDYDKVKDKPFTFYNHSRYLGYNTKLPIKNRIKRIEEYILGEIDNSKEYIHLNNNPLDNRKCNLQIVTKFMSRNFHYDTTLLNSYNDIISRTNFDKGSISLNTKEFIENETQEVSIKKPKVKEIKIEGVLIPETIKDYLFYTPVKNGRTDYFYLVGHPEVFSKTNKRRLQGTKSKELSTKEKFDDLLDKLKMLSINFW